MEHLEHHHSHLHYLLNRELSEIYWTIAIRYFAMALVSIFVPIYLLQQGFALQYVFLFYAVISFVWLIFSYFSTKLSSKIGLKHGILIAMPFLIAFFLLLRSVTALNGIFFLAAVIYGIHGSLFWTNFHIDFAAFSSRKKRTRQVGGYTIICSIVAAIGPVIGGLLLLYSSFNILFIIVAVILLLAAIPLSMSKEIYAPKNFSFKHVIKHIGIKNTTGFIGFGMISCATIAWPIFIFLILKGYLQVGSLTSVTLLISIVTTFFVGKWADKVGKGKILRLGSVLNAIAWTFRIFVGTGLEILGINIFYGLVGPAGPKGPVFDALMYDSTKRKHIAEMVTVREMMGQGSRFVFCTVLFFAASLHFALALGILGSLGVLAFSFQRKRI